MNTAMQICQQRFDNAEPTVAWIDTQQGMGWINESKRTLLLGFDVPNIVSYADFVREFSQQRAELDEKDGQFELDRALIAGGMTPRRYSELAASVAYELLYAKRDIAEKHLEWLR